MTATRSCSCFRHKLLILEVDFNMKLTAWIQFQISTFWFVLRFIPTWPICIRVWIVWLIAHPPLIHSLSFHFDPESRCTNWLRDTTFEGYWWFFHATPHNYKQDSKRSHFTSFSLASEKETKYDTERPRKETSEFKGFDKRNSLHKIERTAQTGKT